MKTLPFRPIYWVLLTALIIFIPVRPVTAAIESTGNVAATTIGNNNIEFTLENGAIARIDVLEKVCFDSV